MPQGTITLPSGDKLLTQTETLSSGALVHREEVVISGTIIDHHALPTNSPASTSDFGLPVRVISDQVFDFALKNTGVAGTPLRFDPTGTTTQPVSVVNSPSVTFVSPQPISTIAGTVQVAFIPSSTQNVNIITPAAGGTTLALFSEQQSQTTVLNSIDVDILSVRNAVIGTPAVKFASPQSITWSGTPSVIASNIPVPLPITDNGGSLTIDGAVSISGTISAPDYARYSEQQTQTTSLSLLDDIVHAFNAVIGKSALIAGQRDDVATTTATEDNIAPVRITTYRAQHVSLRNESGNEIGTAGTPLRFDPTGTTTQPVSISNPIDIANVAGTVNVVFTPASVQSVTITTPAAGGTTLALYSEQQTQTTSLNNINTSVGNVRTAVLGTIGVNINTMPAVSISGTISMPDYARFSEQLTQTSRLTTIDTDILSVFNAVMGTPAVKFPSAQSVNIANTPSITFSGQQPVHGTVIVNSLPAITIASNQTVGISGTISFADYARYSEQITQTTSLQLIDDIVHTFNAVLSKVAAIGGQVDDQSITLGTEGNVAPIRITPYRAEHVSLRSEGGFEVGTAGTPLRFDPTGTTTQPVSNTVLSVVGGGAEATAQRVTIASDSTGNLNVKLLNYGHSGTPLRVDPTGTTTQPISFSVAQPISTIAGTVAVNTQTNIRNFKTARIDVGASGDTTIVSAVTAKRLKVYAVNMNAERAGTIQAVWKDGTAPLSGTQMFLDREGLAHSVQPPAFLFAPQAGTAVVFHASANQFASGMRGMVSYWDSDDF